MQPKKLSFLFFTAVMLVMAISGALAQSQKTAHAMIPFEFWIGGDRLPAGDYVIEHLEESTSYLYFRSTDGRRAHANTTLLVDACRPMKANLSSFSKCGMQTTICMAVGCRLAGGCSFLTHPSPASWC